MFLDNITVSPYPLAQKKEMAIYMDDVVVSTVYIGPDYVIGGEVILPDPPRGLEMQ